VPHRRDGSVGRTAAEDAVARLRLRAEPAARRTIRVDAAAARARGAGGPVVHAAVAGAGAGPRLVLVARALTARLAP
jgi:hypothetical protein